MTINYFAALALAALPAALSAQEAPAGHVLVWADEFDKGRLPDAKRWTYDTHRNAEGWYNNELQYYSARRAENARIEDGRLIIEARRETLDKGKFSDFGGQAYTSARMLSQPVDWRYGRVVTRAKLPCGRGTWPAIWMLPVAANAGWPRGGEIDIMEHVGHEPGVVHASVHTDAYNHVKQTHRTATTQVPDACTAFHDYVLDWSPTEIRISVDDKPYFTFANDGKGDAATWPFDKPFRLILNIAVGGMWGGAQGVDDAAMPQRMEVDYVRFYRKDG